jgi:hypothetical protein
LAVELFIGLTQHVLHCFDLASDGAHICLQVMYSVRDKDFPRYYLLVQDAAAALVDDKR